MSKNTLNLDDMMGFAQDIDVGFAHRDTPNPPSFVLDANVVWFLDGADDQTAGSSAGNTGKTLGNTSANALMRWSVEQLLARDKTLRMLEPHKRESDLAFAERHDWDYPSLVEAVEDAVKQARESRPNGSREEIALQIVERLKAGYSKPFQVLSDVLKSKGSKSKNFATRTSRKLVRKDLGTPPELQERLDEIGKILSSDNRRASYSVRQDVKALRDLALINGDNPNSKTILLTLDKRLIDSVRVGRIWGDKWSSSLLVESLDTFWIWFLGGNKDAPGHESFRELRRILSDYRDRAKTMFLTDVRNGAAEFVWLSSSEWLERYASGASDSRLSLDQVADSDHMKFVKERISEAIDKQKLAAQPDEEIALLRSSCSRFFGEVGKMLPSLQISSVPGMDQSERLRSALLSANLSVEAFFDAIRIDIHEHASQSIRFLGTATMLAPRMLSAIEIYRERSSAASRQIRFIQRLPVPIQSSEFDLEIITKLVRNKEIERDFKFDALLDRQIRTGPIADLIIAYLLVHAGDWAEAGRICKTSRTRHSHNIEHVAVAYEMALLEAAILRIYKTDPMRLYEADELLETVSRMEFARPPYDPGDNRIKLERLAIRVNRILLDKYFDATSGRGVSGIILRDEVLELLEKLFALKAEIRKVSYYGNPLGEKLIANANTNIMLLGQFLLKGDLESSSPSALNFRASLQEGVERLSSSLTTRVSFFEQVVTCYAVLINQERVKISDTERLTIRATLDTILGYLLQRRDDINRFEYWIFREIDSAIKEARGKL